MLAMLLSADPWEFADEKTGELRRGVTFWYVNSYREQGERSVGFVPTKVSGTSEVFDSVRAKGFPAVCVLDLSTRPGKENKATLTVVGAKYLRKIDFAEAAPVSK